MQNGLIDTHAHLTTRFNNKSIEEIVAESKKAGLTAIILASSNLAESEESIKLAQKFPGFLYASVGIHPQKTDPENKTTISEQLLQLEKLLTANCLLHTVNCKLLTAIGETGLDFSPAPESEEDRSKEDQEKLFRGQIELSLNHNLPLVIHAREAVDEVIQILTQYPKARGVFHCYAGGRKRIAKILALSSPNEWFFGFDGNLTYDEGLQNIILLIPENRLLLETDSPFLTPEPHRGEVNTPANLALIVKKVNAIFQKDLSAQILENTRSLFGI